MAAPHRSLVATEVPRFAPHALARVWADAPFLALLENPGEPSELGRYAYVCRDPFWQLSSKRGRCWSGRPLQTSTQTSGPCHSLFDELERLLARYGGTEQGRSDELPPFCGGAVGYLGYELLYELEDIPDRGQDDPELPDACLHFYDLVYACDLLEGRCWLLATGFGDHPAEAAEAARARQREGLALLERARPKLERERARDDALAKLAARHRGASASLGYEQLEPRGIHPTIAPADYLASIAAIKRDILAGRVFEVCLTQRFDCPLPAASMAELYAALRAVNPAPMSAYLRARPLELEVLSASPERFLSLERGGAVETRPIKGTRARAEDPALDQARREDLLSAEKDRAENLMIVDLCRNDLGKVCTFGSVEVSELCAVHPYAFTWQMISTIRGQLREGLGPVDLLRASFPGGSMTGAPKVEAMKIIDALEPTKRGVFSGAIGYLDFEGALDLSIVIRTLVRRGEHLSFHVGGAIVADSVPEDEYQETLDKAHGLVLALDMLDASTADPRSAMVGPAPDRQE